MASVPSFSHVRNSSSELKSAAAGDQDAVRSSCKGTDPTGETTELNYSSSTFEQRLEWLREHEYPQLRSKVYLDHAGTAQYAKSLMDSFTMDMMSNLYGNPHSDSTPSALSGKRVDEIREQTLNFFNANPEEWDLIFVANATAAIKLATECFRDYTTAQKIPFWYGHHKDAHTSLVGSRQMADKHRCFGSDDEVESWLESHCAIPSKRGRGVGLFAYPGQSNMTGRRLPLEWCRTIQEKTNKSAPVYSLLDAAALATTAPIDLSDIHKSPNFVAVSFYKIFGFPNLGALMVQKRCEKLLTQKRYFGGGSVDMVIAVDDTWHAKKQKTIHDQLEDGTLPFHAIFALGHAIDVHERLYGPTPMKRISERTAILSELLYTELNNLYHRNGRPVTVIYKDPRTEFGNPISQGATIALNILRADGTPVGYADVEKEADAEGIFVRSGSLCNPGGLATYLGWTPEQMKAAFAAGHRCSKPIQSVNGKPTGVVRVSLGAMSTKNDIEAFVSFVRSKYLDLEAVGVGVLGSAEDGVPVAVGVSRTDGPGKWGSFSTQNLSSSEQLSYESAVKPPRGIRKWLRFGVCR